MKNNKILTALLALAIALGLWFYVVTVVSPESTKTYYNIPVALEGENILTDRGLMIIGGKDATVTMEVYGNRTDLDKVNSGNITLVADLTRIDNAGEVELSYSYSFPGDVPYGALTVQSRSPGSIKLTVADRVSKNVPVRINWVGEAPDGSMYIVDTDNVTLDNTEIRITGPDTVLDQIASARIDVDLTGKTETFAESYPITLCDENGNGVNAELVTVPTGTGEVRAQVKIEYYKNIILDVDVEDGGGATQETSSIIIKPKTIKVSGNQKVLSKLTKIVIGTIKLEELTGSKNMVFPISLDEGLTNLSGETEAEVLVSFPSLSVKELAITDIEALNVPEGMTHELVTKVLKISVRGPKDVVNKLTEKDIKVTIDFDGAAAGTSTFKPVITIDGEKFPGVGAIGTYSINATLQQDQDAAQ